MKKKLINYEAAEEAIKRIEMVLEEYDAQEKRLILGFVQQRMAKAAQELLVKETVDGNPIYKMASKFLGKDKKDDGDDINA